jgi:transposase
VKHSNRSRAVLKPRTPASVESLTIGIDLGDRRSHICVLDGAGETVREEDLSTGPHSFEVYFKTMPRAVVALEVGMHLRWASRVLQECGHDVIVATPPK